jgi:peroxiredoxin family protein
MAGKRTGVSSKNQRKLSMAVKRARYMGMNLLLDALQKEGVEIIACSGFTRVSRV